MPIRILHIVTYMGRGGLETMIMNYYRHIDREKVQFDFLVHRDYEADYDQEILSLGGRIYHIQKLIPWSHSYKKKLKNFFNAHPEYKIVHVHQDCLSSVSLKCAKECGVPVRIAHSHNSNQDKNWKYIIKRFYMKKIPTYATELLACSKSAGEWMFQGHPFRVVYNAIETKIYEPSELSSNEICKDLNLKNATVIGHIGRFAPQKNQQFLIDIFYECLKIDSNIKLILVGDGEGKKKCEEKVAALKIRDKVIFTGIRKDVHKLLQVMDVFVFPSLYEGLGITVVEAQAAGLPCVISDCIPKECVVTTDRVTIKNLEQSAAEWAQHILQRAKDGKKNCIDEVKAAGYEITTAAKQLEEYYLQK